MMSIGVTSLVGIRIYLVFEVLTTNLYSFLLRFLLKNLIKGKKWPFPNTLRL